MAGDENHDQFLDDIGDQLIAYLEKGKKILQELEVLDGPKVETEHIEICGLPSGLMFENKNEAASTNEAILECIENLKLVRRKLRIIPSAVTEWMTVYSDVIIPEPGPDDDPDYFPRRDEHRSFENLFDALIAEFQAEAKRIEEDQNKRWSGRGPSADWEAREVAVKIAKLYIRLRPDETPTTWVVGKGKTPSTPSEPIGNYDARFQASWWPPGVIESALSAYTLRHRLEHVRAIVSATTTYRRIVERTDWQAAGVEDAVLITPEAAGGAMRKAPRGQGEILVRLAEGGLPEGWSSSDGLGAESHRLARPR